VEQLSSPPVISGDRVAQSLVFCVMFCGSLLVLYTTTYAISAYHHWCCEFESRSGWGVQHYV